MLGGGGGGVVLRGSAQDLGATYSNTVVGRGSKLAGQEFCSHSHWLPTGVFIDVSNPTGEA